MDNLFVVLLQVSWWALLLLFIKHACERFSSIYPVKWFRPLPCSWREKYKWDDIKEIIECDPLTIQEKAKANICPSWPKGWVVFADILILMTGSIVFGIVADALGINASGILPWLNGTWLCDKSMLIANFFGINGSTSLSIPFDNGCEKTFGAVIVLLAGLYTAANEIRAKVRSENRQKWIDGVRKNLAIVIVGIPKQDTWNIVSIQPNTKTCEVCKCSINSIDVYDRMPIDNNVDLSHIRLELLLNPSEKDHRTLGMLTRKGFGLTIDNIDAEVIKNIGPIQLENGTKKQCLGCFEHRKSQVNHDYLISLIIRISNAILKREWELVKYGK